MIVQRKELLNIVADAMAIDPNNITEASTFDDLGGMDSISRLSMISLLESQVGAEAICDDLNTVNDVPSLLKVMQSRGLVE